MEQQCHEQGALAGAAELERLLLFDHLERPQNSELSTIPSVPRRHQYYRARRTTTHQDMTWASVGHSDQGLVRSAIGCALLADLCLRAHSSERQRPQLFGGVWVERVRGDAGGSGADGPGL